MKDIPWFEWIYACAEDGRVWSYKNLKFLKPTLNKETWYLFVSLWDRNITVHRLSAITHKENPYNYPVVRHLDNNKLNNHFLNLEWCTHKTNRQQAQNDGLCKVSLKQIENCRKMWIGMRKKVMQLTREGILCRIYNSITDASRITGVCWGHIWACAKWTKYRKTAGGYYWKYC